MIFVKNLESVSDQEWSKTDKYPGVRWKFLIDADVTWSSGLSLGFAEIEPGGDLILHYHSPAEIYVVTDGVGTLNKSGELEEIKKGDVDVVVNQLESIFKEYKADKSVIDYITNDLNYNELINGFGWLKTERPTPNDLVYAILSWIINFKRYNPDKGFDSSDIGNQLSIIYFLFL